MKSSIFVCVMWLLFTCAGASGQETRSDVTLSGNGLFPSESTHNGVRRQETESGGVLASFRFWFTHGNGFEFNYAHARDSQKVTKATGTDVIHTGAHEVTFAYVRRFNASGSIQPFVLAGLGLMQYSPINSGSSLLGAQPQNKPTMLFGGGFDYGLSHHWAVRLQFRELVNAAPSFKLEQFRTNSWMHVAEPSAGITFRF